MSWSRLVAPSTQLQSLQKLPHRDCECGEELAKENQRYEDRPTGVQQKRNNCDKDQALMLLSQNGRRQTQRESTHDRNKAWNASRRAVQQELCDAQQEQNQIRCSDD